jgi:NADH dehydrogenase
MAAAAEMPHVVILGGGFGGLYAARALGKAQVRVTLVDRRNHHLFQPLLYQVATAALNPADIAMPIRRVLRKQRNCTVVLAEAAGVDVAARKVVLTDGEIPFDHLIVATGATHSYFGHDGWAKAAPGLKTIEDALEIRKRVLLAYEAAERETDPERRRAWLTFAIVGGGPTGVELAGALAEIARHVLERDFRRIDPREARVVLVEAGPRLLPAFTEESSRKTREQLERIGAEVLTGTAVTGIDAGGVTLAGDPPPGAAAGPRRIDARTVLWAAGVAASPLARSLGAPLDRAGRVQVNPDLGVPGAPGVYVIGDLAAFTQDGKPLPGVAQVAMQGGVRAAKNILRVTRGEPTQPFRYVDKGSLATIGRAAAVAEIGGLRFSGFFAWIVWLLIHILFLIGFRNRVLVMLQWAWAYLRFERGARLITGPVAPLLEDDANRDPPPP